MKSQLIAIACIGLAMEVETLHAAQSPSKASGSPVMGTLVQVVKPIRAIDKQNFFKWIANDNESSLWALLQEYPHYPVNELNAQGDAGIHIAARNGKLSLVNLLLDYGADAETLNSEGHTAKAIAEMAAHTEVRNRLHLLRRYGTKKDLGGPGKRLMHAKRDSAYTR